MNTKGGNDFSLSQLRPSTYLGKDNSSLALDVILFLVLAIIVLYLLGYVTYSFGMGYDAVVNSVDPTPAPASEESA